MFDLVLSDGEIVVPDTGIVRGSIGVKDGRIAMICLSGENLTARETIDCRDRWIMPGLIDPHTHIGFGSNETDFATESRSAVLDRKSVV